MPSKEFVIPNPETEEMWYQQWLNLVDKWCLGLAGISYKDLPDYDFVVNFEEGVSPEEMATMMLKEEGYGV